MAAKLRQYGFTRIRPLLGGLDAWIDAGLPVDGADADADGGAGGSGGANQAGGTNEASGAGARDAGTGEPRFTPP